jgi:hypothetical protein
VSLIAGPACAYQELLGCQSGHGGEEYERLLHDWTLVLQLHRFEVEHHHGRIGDPSARPYGSGGASPGPDPRL